MLLLIKLSATLYYKDGCLVSEIILAIKNNPVLQRKEPALYLVISSFFPEGRGEFDRRPLKRQRLGRAEPLVLPHVPLSRGPSEAVARRAHYP